MNAFLALGNWNKETYYYQPSDEARYSNLKIKVFSNIEKLQL
jgi:hypothetical protein